MTDTTTTEHHSACDLSMIVLNADVSDWDYRRLGDEKQAHVEGSWPAAVMRDSTTELLSEGSTETGGAVEFGGITWLPADIREPGMDIEVTLTKEDLEKIAMLSLLHQRTDGPLWKDNQYSWRQTHLDLEMTLLRRQSQLLKHLCLYNFHCKIRLIHQLFKI